jgi:hypothetical protein
MTTTAAATPKTRRWIASVIATSANCDVALPFQRGSRRRPAAFAKAPAAPQPRPQAIAAR